MMIHSSTQLYHAAEDKTPWPTTASLLLCYCVFTLIFFYFVYIKHGLHLHIQFMINLFSSMSWYLTTCLDMQFICVSYDMKNDGHVFMSQNQQCTYSITLLLLLLTVTVTQKGVRLFLFSLEQMILFYKI